jgi:hypothetical protein
MHTTGGNPLEPAGIAQLEAVRCHIERRRPRGMPQDRIGSKHFLDGPWLIISLGQLFENLLD